MRLGLIGFGAIGQEIAQRLEQSSTDPAQDKASIAAVLLRENSPNWAAAQSLGLPVVTGVQAMLACRVNLVIECAGHAGLTQCGAQVLTAGVPILIASVGALADQTLLTQLMQYCGTGAQILLPAGALGGLDALASARHAGALEVTYISEKPIAAWRGTAAESMINLDSVQGVRLFFTGTARQAAMQFPQNANVAAAVGFAGVGLDQTQVQLCAVEGLAINRHRIKAQGQFGKMEIVIEGKPLARNPKTSILAATSLIEATLNLSRTIRLA
jgi:aspartate dehydrogenase